MSEPSVFSLKNPGLFGALWAADDAGWDRGCRSLLSFAASVVHAHHGGRE